VIRAQAILEHHTIGVVDGVVLFSNSVQQESPRSQGYAVRRQLVSNASLSRNMRAGHAKWEAGARWKTHLEPEPGVASGMLDTEHYDVGWEPISEGV
jgi:hypothetical protein